MPLVNKRVWIKFKLRIMFKIRQCFLLRGSNGRWKRILKYIAYVGIFLFVVDISGVFRHPFELDYETQFTYPLEHPNFKELIDKFR